MDLLQVFKLSNVVWDQQRLSNLHVSIQKPDLALLEYSQPSQLSEELIKLTSIKDSPTHPSVSLPAPRLTRSPQLRRSVSPLCNGAALSPRGRPLSRSLTLVETSEMTGMSCRCPRTGHEHRHTTPVSVTALVKSQSSSIEIVFKCTIHYLK